MSKEKFLIIAQPLPDDCFGRFTETENRYNLDNWTEDESDPYSWIEKSFELVLVRYREATHICSFTPSARQYWLENVFVGEPNAAWEYDPDPEGLERESGGEIESYGTYRDEYDPRFVCETFEIDPKDLGLEYPDAMLKTLSSRDCDDLDAIENYTESLWEVAIETAHELVANGLDHAPILNTIEYRKWSRENRAMKFKEEA